MARKSVSPRFQSATCARSLPLNSSTSSFLIGGGGCFFPTAVTVAVAKPLASAARACGATTNPNKAADTAKYASIRPDRDILFIKVILPLIPVYEMHEGRKSRTFLWRECPFKDV